MLSPTAVRCSIPVLLLIAVAWTAIAEKPTAEAPPPGLERMTENTFRLAAGQRPPAASLEAAAFVLGSWTTEALGGVVDEVWAPERGGAMMGMFRLVKGDEPSFYELFILHPEGESLNLRLKHFDGTTFHAWEAADETVDFPLVALDDDTLYFEGLTYRRTGADRLTVFLAMGTRDGMREEVFRFRRAAPGGVPAG